MTKTTVDRSPQGRAQHEHEGDRTLDDLYEHGTLITSRLSTRARDRYHAALWYAWGRDDAGDTRLRDLPKVPGAIGNDFAFAEFTALEAERYERQHMCMLRNIADQYERFVAGLETHS